MTPVDPIEPRDINPAIAEQLFQRFTRMESPTAPCDRRITRIDNLARTRVLRDRFGESRRYDNRQGRKDHRDNYAVRWQQHATSAHVQASAERRFDQLHLNLELDKVQEPFLIASGDTLRRGLTHALVLTIVFEVRQTLVCLLLKRPTLLAIDPVAVT